MAIAVVCMRAAPLLPVVRGSFAKVMVVMAMIGALAGPAPADAPEDPSVAVLPIEFASAIATADRVGLSDRFGEGLVRAGFSVTSVSPEQARTCANPECYQEMAKGSNTQAVVEVSLTKREGDYDVRALLVDGTTGDVVAEVQSVCELCGVAELGDFMGGVAARLRQKTDVARAPTMLVVNSYPSGAEVLVDGETVGQTPLELAVEPGAHEVEVGLEGHRSEHGSVELSPGITQAVAFRLARRGTVPPWAPWTAIGVGAAMLGAGVALLVIDERPIRRDCNADVEGRCEFLYDTLAGGVALAAGGIAFLGTGVGLAIYRGKQRPVEANASISPRGVALTGRF
jgi:hypothetical protein